MNRNTLVSIMVVAVVVVVLFGSYAVVRPGNGSSSSSDAVTTSLSDETVSEISPAEGELDSFQKALDLAQPREICQDIVSLRNEMPCETAVVTALAEYPGEITLLDRREIDLEGAGEERDTAAPVTVNAWFMRVNTFKPLVNEAGAFNIIEVYVDRNTGEVGVYSFVEG